MIGTELVITGADTADTVDVTTQGPKIKVTATLGGTKYSQTVSGVTRVRVDARGGDDTITFGNLPIPTWTDAGAGNDTVTGGTQFDEIYLGAGDDTADAGAGDDFVAGGAGQDLIQGGAGNDLLYGGDGEDLVIGGPGVDLLFGQGGNDILVGGSATVRNTKKDSLRQVLTDWDPASTGVGGYANVRGRLSITNDGSSGDQLTGGAGTDWFWVELPPDTIADREAGESVN
jgi:Ca2+-binding RTX toxin-like protein